MLELACPWALLLLLAPALVARLAPPYREPRAFLAVPFIDRLGEAAGQQPGELAQTPTQPLLQRAGRLLVWMALVLALARPQFIHEPLTRTLPGRDLLIAVDLSASMETADFSNAADERVDRVSAVKEVLDAFLARRDGDRVGLLFFGSAPYLQAPFTEDLALCRELLADAEPRMAGPQTQLGDAIGKAIAVFEDSELDEKVLIVLADGNDSGSLVPPVKAAEIAQQHGIRIHTIGMGDPATLGEQRLDTETLAAIAQVTGGESFLAMDRGELETVYARIDALAPRQVETLSYRPVQELYALPLAVAVLLSIAGHGAALFAARRRLRRGSEAVAPA